MISQNALMKWHENKSCLIRFDCSHIENQGRKIINFFGISRIQIRTKIRLDRKRPELDYILVIRRRSYFGFLKFQDFLICPQSKISKIWERRTKTIFKITDRTRNSNKMNPRTESNRDQQSFSNLGPDQDSFFFKISDQFGPIGPDLAVRRSLSRIPNCVRENTKSFRGQNIL